MFRKQTPWWLALALVSAAAACKSETGGVKPEGDASISPSQDAATNPGEDAGMVDPPDAGAGAWAESQKSTLRFKRTERLRNDIARAVAIDPAQLCRELGQYSCTDLVHTISLGGVEPYVLGIREPLDQTTVTAPLAVDRVVLSGCEQRVSLDLQDPLNALIFRDLNINGAGELSEVTAAGVQESIDRLYKNALLRPATAPEIEHLRTMYGELAATGDPGTARDWAILSCYAVISSMESLFY